MDIEEKGKEEKMDREAQKRNIGRYKQISV